MSTAVVFVAALWLGQTPEAPAAPESAAPLQAPPQAPPQAPEEPKPEPKKPEEYLPPLTDTQRERARAYIEEMKRDPKGAYAGISWYCNDGTEQLPKLDA